MTSKAFSISLSLSSLSRRANQYRTTTYQGRIQKIVWEGHIGLESPNATKRGG